MNHYTRIPAVGIPLILASMGSTQTSPRSLVPVEPGTPVMIKDIRSGSLSSQSTRWVQFGVLGNELFFAADDGVNGNELWKTDGTTSGTGLVKDINPTMTYPNSNPDWFAGLGGMILFSASDGTGVRSLWRTDGTADGTIPIKQGSVSSPTEIVALGGQAFFVANSISGLYGVLATDGTDAGTHAVSPRVSNSSNLVSFQGRVHFLGSVGGYGLWATDGTDPGTVLIQSLPFSNLNAPNMEAAGGCLWLGLSYQTGNGYFTEVWKSDGTPAGTVRLIQSPGVRFVNAHSFTPVGATTLFVFDDGIHGEVLWSSDGTPSGTALFMDMEPGWVGSYPSSLVVFGGTVFFSASQFFDRDPWTTDGTVTGTTRFANLNPSSSSGAAGSFVPVRKDLMYFTAIQSPASGVELWQSDGTPAGTFQVVDLLPGIYSSGVRAMTLASGEVFFFADDGVHGTELWKIFPGATAQAIGSPCAAPGSDPRLSATEPALGSSWSIQGRGFALGATLNLFASLETVPRLVQSCDLFVDPLTAVLVHSTVLTQATWNVNVGVPNVLALTGISVTLQAAQAPSASPLGVDLSNGLVGTFGS